MPKKGKRSDHNKRGAALPPGGGAAGGGNTSDEDSVFNDDAQSVVSEESTNSFFKDDPSSDDSEAFEEKLSDALELAGHKDAKNRTKAVQGLCKAFSKKYIPWFIEDRRLTITDAIERSLKRGKVDEQMAAANLMGVFCVQLGSASDDDIYKEMKSVLTPILLDPTADPRTRASVATAIGLVCFLLGDVSDYDDTLDNLEKVFSGSYKGGAKHSPETLAMHTAALDSWTLLVTMMSPTKCYKTLESHIQKFLHLLSSPDVDLRIAVGEAIVGLYETICDREELEEEAYEVVQEAVDVMKELSKDSHKYRSKKDKKEQKSSFRDIVRYIEDGEELYDKSSFGQGEILEIETWAARQQYAVLRKCLGSGLNIQLSSNPLLREIFELGPVVLDVDKEEMKNAKKQHIKMSKQNNMMKDLARGKQRDKKRAGMY